MSPDSHAVKMSTIARRRLINQHLAASTLREAAEVVRALGAVQAQDYTGAKWAIAQRTRRLTDADVEGVFATGAILRTHVLRPTWHFILPEDARWLLELTAPRIRAAVAYHHRQHRIDAAAFRKSHLALERALRDGQHRTRSELAAALGRAGVDAASGERVGHLLMEAELDRVIISGPRRGRQFTYALFDERVPTAPPRDRDEALGDHIRRYFATRGPATLRDFAWWSGLTLADAKRGVEIAADFLSRESGDDGYWSARSARTLPRPVRSAHLLPNYDEYIVGFKDRSAVVARLRAARVRTRVDGLIGHVVVLDGQVVGLWRRMLDGTAELEVRLLVSVTAPERALVQRATRRFGDFLGSPVRVRERLGSR